MIVASSKKMSQTPQLNLSNGEIISRQALGRIASLGQLYNAHNDVFCGSLLFPNISTEFIKPTPTQKIFFQSIFENTLKEKLNKFNIEAELKASFSCGLFNISAGGNAKYLSSSSSNARESSASLTCQILTTVKNMHTFYNNTLILV
jgi:hypothetical protein